MSELEEHYIKFSSAFLILIFIAGLVAGGIASAYIASQQINNLREQVSDLKSQVSKQWGFQNVTNQNIVIYQNETSLSEIYEKVKDSVVLIQGRTSSGEVQGSGFVYNYSGIMVVITNNHVVHGTSSISVTFSNGNGYKAEVNATDPYADIAILTVEAPQKELKPLEIVSSSTLKVGDYVIAIGNPYGLIGSMTTGVISALNRTITEEEYTGGFAIANIIQTSTPINPGNSGGPLLNYLGKVVGITTAIVEESQGLGFAVPSNTILREIQYLIISGFYDRHSYLGVKGTDMSYELAQELGVNVTYGWRVVDYLNPSPAREGGVLKGDIIIAVNGSRIKNVDDMLSYLEENTLPGQNLILTVVRGNQILPILVVLGKRP